MRNVSAIVFVYDFHPGAETAMQQHFSQTHHPHNVNGYSNPYNLDGAPRPYSAGKGKGANSFRFYALEACVAAQSTVWEYCIWDIGQKILT